MSTIARRPPEPHSRRTSQSRTLQARCYLVSRDSAQIIASIRADAEQHGGRISVNRGRRTLKGRIALPQSIGATYSALARSGVIEVAGYEISDDGHHRGSLIRTWLLKEARLP